MRRLGVFGENLPTRRERNIEPADFTIAGLYAGFNRRYDKTFRFRDTREAQTILGGQTNPADYGWDALNGFFANLQGQPGSVVVAPYKRNGDVQAQIDLQGTFTVSSAYLDEPSFGASGNRTGFTVEIGSAFSSPVVEAYDADGYTILESIAGYRLNDLLDVNGVYVNVTELDESRRGLKFSAPTTFDVGDEFVVRAYRVHSWTRSLNGVVNEVDQLLGRTWVTLNEGDPDRYLADVFKNSTLFAFQPTGSTFDVTLDEEPAIVYLQGGADGTRPATVSDFAPIWTMFDNQPVRMVAAVETSDTEVQKSLEAYCKSREDNPIAFITGQMNMVNKGQVLLAGQGFQRGNEVDAVFVHNWVAVADPFASSPTAPRRTVPNGGHLMGQWIQSIGLNGIHSSPARKDTPLLGVSNVVGYQAINDFDRTDLAEAGANVIQFLPGRGIVVRNHFTPSTSPEFRYSNGVIQRNYIKVSVVASLQTSENQPNTIQRVAIDRAACAAFMAALWDRGSNGNVQTGETFGQYQKSDGSMSTQADAYEVIGDVTNNSISSLMAGERNIDIYFAFPAPAGSIKIGVGLIYRVQ